MPWKSNSIFDVRRTFVTLALSPDSNIRELCRRFNISPNTGYQTLERYRAEGDKELQDRSRTPHRSPLRCSKAIEAAVLSVHENEPTWGGRKIAKHLRLSGHAAIPAPSTISSILARNGRSNTLSEHSRYFWLLHKLHKKINRDELPPSILSHPDLGNLIERIEGGGARDRRQAIAVLASRSGLPTGLVCDSLNICRQTYRRYARLFERQ
jgi:transposase-like protein